MKRILRLLAVPALAMAAIFIGGGTAQAENCPIALTYDDGPGPYTNQIVDALAAHGAVATFFMVGNMAASHSGAAAYVASHGNQIGDHSTNHDYLTHKSAEAAKADVDHAADMISAASGVYPQMMRPPYGETNGAIVTAVGRPEILWSYDSLDYATHNTASTIRNVTNNVHCGDIILMHDIHSSTAAAANPILDNLQSRGFQMVTVENLIGMPGPGIYSHQ